MIKWGVSGAIVVLWIAVRAALTGDMSGSIGILDGGFAVAVIAAFTWGKSKDANDSHSSDH